MVQPESQALIVLTIFLELTISLTTFILWRRHKIFPIEGRYPDLIITTNIFFLVLLPMQTFNILNVVPCFLYYWTIMPSIVGSFYIQVIRSWLLLFGFELAAEARNANLLPTCQGIIKNNWYSVHRMWMSHRVICLGLAVFPGLTLSVQIGMSSITDWRTDACPDGLPEWIFWSMFIGTFQCLILTIMAIILGRRLIKHKQDGFGLKKEIRSIVTGVSLSLAATISMVLFIQDRRILDFGLRSTLIFSITVTWSNMTIRPLYIAHRLKLARLHRVAHLTEIGHDVMNILSHPGLNVALLEFCATEFCTETLIFWNRITQFRTIIGHTINNIDNAIIDRPLFEASSSNSKAKDIADKWLQEARSIYDSFIVVNSYFEVNIPAMMRNHIHRRLNELSLASAGDVSQSLKSLGELFVPAQHEALNLISTNSLSRFLSSDIYKESIASIAHNDTILLIPE